jgi:predicted alpha-1,2-mannosidase
MSNFRDVVIGRFTLRRLGALALFGIALLIAVRQPTGAESEPDPGTDVAALVHPLAGTETGGVFPGADTPFGMVQYSPNTGRPGGGGYRHSRPTTWGFATTHLSGPGCPAMGDVVSLPTTGRVSTVDAVRQRTTFSRATEQASAGYYAVDLNASRVHAELTATTRTGWARFTYPGSAQANVIIDPGANLRGVRTASVRVRGDHTVEGSVSSWGYWNACPDRSHNRYTLHFSMQFDRPFTGFGTGNGSKLHPGGRAADGADAGAYVSFNSATDPRPVVSKIGISFVDLAGARNNLEQETGEDFDFDQIHQRTRAAWNDLLGRVQVGGGSEDQRETFYTALYHSLLHPNVFSDADGRYEGFDQQMHRAPAGQAHYTNFSMWDTYRSAHQVIDLVAPERVGDMMRSLLDDGRQGGWLPKWPYGQYDTNEMVGDPVANVMADAFLKGLLHGEDVGPAYAALLHNATDVPRPANTPLEGRTGLDDYLNRGFVPYRGGDDHLFAASINMEYAVNDCALALMAGRLGREADARYLLRRAKRYRHTIDPSSRFARPRRNDGSWLRPFSERSREGFKEGSAWQYTWLVPQDVSGLAAALGGRNAMLAKLDRFFAYGVIASGAPRARSVWRGPARYSPRNELDLHAPYLYNYLGVPWKTQDIVRAAESLFTTAPNGLPGGDDLGTMSGWYVLSALGLFPATGGDDHYALTTPMFDHVVVTPPQAFYPGGPLVIDAPGASAGLRYVQGVTLGGGQLATSQVSHADLTRGAHLSFALGTTPGSSWATGTNTPASACAANPSTPDLRIHVGRARASRGHAGIRLRLHNAGDARAGGLLVRLRLPRGWSAARTSGSVRALGPGGTATQSWRLRPLRGHRVGRVRVDVRWAGPGGRGGALRTFGTATARVADR